MITQIFTRIRLIHIVIFGFILRFAFFLVKPDFYLGDGGTYMNAGAELFRTGMISYDFTNPLYPILTHILGSIYLIKIFDIIVSTLTIYLFHEFVSRIFKNRGAALLTAFMTAVYPFFIFYSNAIMTESLFLLMFYFAILCLYEKKFIWASVVLTLSLLLRPNTDYLNPILIFGSVFMFHKLGWRETFKQLGIYTFFYVLFLSPWWAHNYKKYGVFVRHNLADALMLYVGNNPMNTSGGGRSNSGDASDAEIDHFWRDYKDPIDRHQAMMNEAVTFIKNNPGHFAYLTYKRVIRFWRLWPYAPEYQAWYYIMTSLMSYGVIFFLSIFYLIKYWRKDFEVIYPLLVIMLYFTGTHSVVAASFRYRLPLEPILIFFSSLLLMRMFKSKFNLEIGDGTK